MNIRIVQKGVPFFQASWAVPPFLASLEQKSNTFCESWNVEYDQITYHILQITVNYTIASKFNQFRNDNSLYLLWKLKKILKKGVPQNAQISKLEPIFFQNFQASWKLVGNSFFGEQLVGCSSYNFGPLYYKNLIAVFLPFYIIKWKDQ